MNELQQAIKEAVENLPEQPKNFFTDFTWLKKVEAIAKKYSLDQEEINILKDETAYAMLGLYNDPSQLNKEISTAFDKDPGVIASIVKEVDEQIITPFNKTFPDTTKEGGENYAPTTAPFNPSKVEIPLVVQEIGSKYDLEFEEISKMADLINKVTAGEKSAANFQDDLTALLSLKTDRARHLTQEIDEKVFKTVRESLKVEKETNGPTIEADTFRQKMKEINISENQKDSSGEEKIIPPIKPREPGVDPYREQPE